MAFDLDLDKGRYRARLAVDESDVKACQALRHRAFFGSDGVDVDRFDATWSHLMVVDEPGSLVCTLRFRSTASAQVLSGYAAEYYGLDCVATTGCRVAEMGRFCSDPHRNDPQILRVAWAALAQVVDRQKAQLVIGCASFPGIDPAPFARVFQQLAQHHTAPVRLLPEVTAPTAVHFTNILPGHAVQLPMPALLRSYLTMGGWVSDHAVVDHAMGTLHVLTVLDVAKVPPARAKVLRALA